MNQRRYFAALGMTRVKTACYTVLRLVSQAVSRSVTSGLVSALVFSIGLPGCISSNEQEVVVYCALDKEFSEKILEQFQNETGTKVLSKFDQESNKTVGLVNDIINRKNRQRADLFWNNEILHTFRLQKLGLLESYRSPEASFYPSQFVSATDKWHGFAARARVLIVNTELLPDTGDRPTSILDLAARKWQGRCAIARPLLGTTATHAAVLFSSWGPERARSFLTEVAENAAVEGGNKQVAINVARGRYAFGLTDTDDAIIEIEQGRPVEIIFPDQGPEQMGTLLIPNTLCIMSGGPNTEQAKKLVDYLLQSSIEERLASGPSAQFPLRTESAAKSRVQPDRPLKTMEVDFEAAAEAWPAATEFLNQTFPLGSN